MVWSKQCCTSNQVSEMPPVYHCHTWQFVICIQMHVCFETSAKHLTKNDFVLMIYCPCRRLSLHDSWNKLAVYVAMDMLVVIEDISKSTFPPFFYPPS